MKRPSSIRKAAAALGRRGGKATSPAKAEAARDNGRQGGRPASDIEVRPRGKWRLYWTGPLPTGATAHGTVRRMRTGEEGALIKTAAGLYAQGNVRALRALDQRAVRAQL